MEDSHSDPTYEAWKPERVSERVSERTTIPILPMRHGNRLGLVSEPETGQYSDPTYEAWKLDNPNQYLAVAPIPILPMRHGNSNERAS